MTGQGPSLELETKTTTEILILEDLSLVFFLPQKEGNERCSLLILCSYLMLAFSLQSQGFLYNTANDSMI